MAAWQRLRSVSALFLLLYFITTLHNLHTVCSAGMANNKLIAFISPYVFFLLFLRFVDSVGLALYGK